MWFDIEIAHEHQLVVGVFPDELPPVDVDALAMQRAAIQVGHVGIGEIDGQQRVVLARIGAEQQRPVVIEIKLQLRQVARVAVVEPVRAAAVSCDIAKMVEDGEGVTVLQDPGARLAKGAGRFDAELGFAFAGLDRRYGHDAAPVPTSLSRGPGSPGGIEFSGLGLDRRSTAEPPPNWWTPLISSDGSGKVSNGPGTASFYG